MTDLPPIIVRTYDGISPQASGHEFTQDAAGLARDGYEPTSQQWQGKALTVTYQRPPTTEASLPPAPSVHYEQRGTGVGGGIGQGIGIGMGCLIFVIGAIVVLVILASMNR